MGHFIMHYLLNLRLQEDFLKIFGKRISPKYEKSASENSKKKKTASGSVGAGPRYIAGPSWFNIMNVPTVCQGTDAALPKLLKLYHFFYSSIYRRIRPERELHNKGVVTDRSHMSSIT